METDKLGGYDPYSSSKAAAEIVTDSYRNSFFNVQNISAHQKAIATARAGNVIGGGDWNKDRIIPDIVKALQKDEKIMVRNPGAIRPWQFVLEPISGYLLLAMRLYENPKKYAGAWNFGPNIQDNLSVKNIVEYAINVFGKGEYETPELMDQPHEANLLKLDITKAVQELKWQPKYNAKQAIEKTMEWYKLPENKLKEFTYKQLKEFQN